MITKEEIKKSPAYKFSNMQYLLSGLANGFRKEHNMSEKSIREYLGLNKQNWKKLSLSEFDGTLEEALRLVHKLSDYQTLKLSEIKKDEEVLEEDITPERMFMLKSPDYRLSILQMHIFSLVMLYKEKYALTDEELRKYLSLNKRDFRKLLNGDYEGSLKKTFEIIAKMTDYYTIQIEDIRSQKVITYEEWVNKQVNL